MTDTPETPTPTPTSDITPSQPVEPVQAPALPYSFKANLKEYRKRVGIWRIGLALIISIFFWVKFGPVVWILSVLAIAAAILGYFYVLSRGRVTLTTEKVEYRSGFGRTQNVPYAELEGAKVFINFLDAGFGIAPRVSVAQKGATSHPINLNSLYWSVDDMDKLIAVLNDKKVPVEYYEDIVQYQAIAKQFPNYATYIERHTGFVALMAVIAILVLVVGIALWVTFN